MLPLPSEDKKVSPYLAFYIINSMKIGIVVLSFERFLVKEAGQDAWISVLIAGIATHIILWMTFQITIKGENDIAVIHKNLFGKWIGGLFTLLLITYLMTLFIMIMRAYIDVIQVWMFPHLQTWYMAFVLAILVYLYFTGGFRVMVGLCVLSFMLTIPLLMLKAFPLKSAHLSYLLPVMEHSPAEILSGAKKMSVIFSGFEVVLFCYPFFKQGIRAHRWAQLGAAFTTSVYLAAVLVSLLYFSEGQLEKTLWPTLTLWKIVDFPFLERFEYAGIAIWLFVMLPNLCLYIWAVTRGLKQLFSIKQKKSILFLLLLAIIVSSFITDGVQIRNFSATLDRISFFILFAYIPFIYLYQWIWQKVRKNQ
ncbi:GerAB/ArcD/ProY family transporter [Bacillus badius]|uniref:GerAB/ArcD/ProY family transporter n=1 Tax=Bacillus badius TaxID=1455 RepID=UPI002E21545E|nr:GerAB/ArcD/ProY family transporter [Bacillus badius]MED0667796.1 GerAB/ArcD/ProY family transporter [Bacillus badius]